MHVQGFGIKGDRRMNVFTVKLNQDEIVEVFADIAKSEDGVLSFYNEEKSLVHNGGGPISTTTTVSIIENLVGMFDHFEYFYIAGDKQ